MTEMPLLVFTLVEQMAVGAFAALVVMQLMGKVKAEKAPFAIAVVVVVLSVLGMLASMAHLGQPMRALNVMRGIGSSPLSHEIIFFGAFVALTLVYAIVAKLQKTTLAKVIGVLGVICGVVAIVFTSICYMNPGVPAWDSFATPLQFFLTTVVCGIPLTLALLATFDKTASKSRTVLWVVFIVLLLTQVAMRYFFFSDIVLLVNTL